MYSVWSHIEVNYQSANFSPFGFRQICPEKNITMKAEMCEQVEIPLIVNVWNSNFETIYIYMLVHFRRWSPTFFFYFLKWSPTVKKSEVQQPWYFTFFLKWSTTTVVLHF